MGGDIKKRPVVATKHDKTVPEQCFFHSGNGVAFSGPKCE